MRLHRRSQQQQQQSSSSLSSSQSRKPFKNNAGDDIGRSLSAAVQSSAFLATFIVSIWAVICLVRNRTRNDSPLGPGLASLVCGLSLLLERPSRRPELALYCAPRALWCLWYRRNGASTRGIHGGLSGLVLATSLAALLTMWKHDRSSLRGSVQTFLTLLL
jgi:hypothetical protein